MTDHLLSQITVFVLAVFVGIEVIGRVPSTLHTPLMSATNAIHGIVLVGAILVAGLAFAPLGPYVGFILIVLASLNVFGGYTVTERPPSNVQYTKGTVAMAKDPADPPGTAGSQFFIVTGNDVDLPPQYAVLGKVVAGAQTVSAIAHVPTTESPDGEDSEPTKPIVISKATVQVN